MTRLILLLSIFTLAPGCTKSAPPDRQLTDTSQTSQAETPTQTEGNAAQQAPSSQPVRPVGAPMGVAAVRTPPPGQAEVEVKGCAAEGAGSEEDAKSFPAKTTRSRQTPLDVATLGTGIVVTREVSHACCLEAKVETQITENGITITELFTGQPCRCMCSSTVRTAVGLQPGEYELVYLSEGVNQPRQEIARQPIEIKSLRDAR